MDIVEHRYGHDNTLPWRQVVDVIGRFREDCDYAGAYDYIDSVKLEYCCNWKELQALDSQMVALRHEEERMYNSKFSEMLGEVQFLDESALIVMQSFIDMLHARTPRESMLKAEFQDIMHNVRSYVECSDIDGRFDMYDSVQARLSAMSSFSRNDIRELYIRLFCGLAEFVGKLLRDDLRTALNRTPRFEIRMINPLCRLKGRSLVLEVVVSVIDENDMPELSLLVSAEPGKRIEPFSAMPVALEKSGTGNYTARLQLRVRSDDHTAKPYGEVRICIRYGKCIPSRFADLVDSVEGRAYSMVKYLIGDGKFSVPIGVNGFNGRSEAHGKYFVGRQDLVDEILSYFRIGCRGQSYIIYGPHYCGKSSLLNKIGERLGSALVDGRNAYKYTFVNAQDFVKDGYENDFLSRVAKMCDPSLPLPPPREDCLSAIRAHGGKLSAEGVTWVIGVDEFTKPYSEFCEYRKKANEGRDDELNAAVERKKDELCHYFVMLRSLVQEGVFNLMAVGQEDTAEMFDDGDFFDAVSRFNSKRLPYLREFDVRSLARVPIVNGDMREDVYREDTLEQIQRLPGGHPCFAQHLMHQIVETMNDLPFPLVTQAVLDEAVRRLLDQTGDARIRWSDLEPFYNLRTPLADKTRVLSFYRKYLSLSKEDCWLPTSKFNDDEMLLIDLLCNRGVLNREDDKIRLSIPIFEMWLRRNGRYLSRRMGNGQ